MYRFSFVKQALMECFVAFVRKNGNVHTITYKKNISIVLNVLHIEPVQLYNTLK